MVTGALWCCELLTIVLGDFFLPSVLPVKMEKLLTMFFKRVFFKLGWNSLLDIRLLFQQPDFWDSGEELITSLFYYEMLLPLPSSWVKERVNKLAWLFWSIISKTKKLLLPELRSTVNLERSPAHLVSWQRQLKHYYMYKWHKWQGGYLHESFANPIQEYCDEFCCPYFENDLKKLRRVKPAANQRLYLMGTLYFSNTFYICRKMAHELATETGNIQIGSKMQNWFCQ